MALDKRIFVTVTSRLFNDEINKLQEKIGSIVPLRDPYKVQTIESIGLQSVCSRDSCPDYVQIFLYLSKCTFAILDEVAPDGLYLTRIDANENYQIKNVYAPFFNWSSSSQLVVVPPVFSRKESTIALESNGVDLVFPSVVPSDLYQLILQRLLLLNLYSRIADADQNAVNIEEVVFQATNITYRGRNYTLDITHNDPGSSLRALDNLALYVAILSALIPRSCLRLVTALMRNDEHELLDVFRGIVPPEFNGIDLDDLNIDDDIARMDAFFTYIQSISAIFNLGGRFHLSSYTPETALATCWYYYI